MCSLNQEIVEICLELGQCAMGKGVVLATAESCTAGGISFYITEVPGSSRWFDRGFVTYTNEAKHDMLGVEWPTLNRHGAVSEAVAGEMARGALEHSRAHLSVAVSGIAGPGGATPGKPVGTVCFGFACRTSEGISVQTQTQHFGGNRTSVRLQTVRLAVQTLIGLIHKL